MLKAYLGAGKDRKEGFVHVDKTPFEGIDYVCDITKGLPFKDSSVDYVFSQDFLEHIPTESKVFVINEIWRVLKNGGEMEHYIPNAGSRNDFGSPSHLSHWNLQQFEHFDIDSYRYNLDHEYEGFIGKFRKVKAELVNIRPDEGYIQARINKGDIEKLTFFMAQSIHVIYQCVK